MSLNLNFLPHIFLLLFAFALFEYFLCHAFWFKSYFRYGLVCFLFKMNVKNNQFIFPETTLGQTFTGVSSFLFPIPAMEFKAFSSNECAFREEFRFRSYLAIMHGMMTFDPYTEKVTIKGKLNYFPLIMLLFVLPVVQISLEGSFSRKDGIFIGPTLFVFFFIIQFIRYLYISVKCKDLFKKAINTEPIAQSSVEG